MNRYFKRPTSRMTKIRSYLCQCSLGDWFVLYQLSKNLNRPFFFDFLTNLGKRYDSEYYDEEDDDDVKPLLSLMASKTRLHEGKKEVGQSATGLKVLLLTQLIRRLHLAWKRTAVFHQEIWMMVDWYIYIVIVILMVYLSLSITPFRWQPPWDVHETKINGWSWWEN